MKADLLVVETGGSVVIRRPGKEKTTAIIIAAAVFALVFLALPWTPGTRSGYASSFFIVVFAICGVALAMWWELTCQWTINPTGKIVKNAGPFSTISYVRERSNVQLKYVEYQNNRQYLIEVVDDGGVKRIGVSQSLEVAERAALAAARILGGNVILDDSAKLKKTAEFRSKTTPKGARSALVLETVSWIVAAILIYKIISPLGGGVVFIGATIYVIWRFIRLSQAEKNADAVLNKK